MDRRWIPYLAMALLVSLVLNLFLFASGVGRQGSPQAFGQAAMGGEGFIMATEQSPDQTPVCFILSEKDHRLLVYKTEVTGHLQLTSARDIGCDLKLRDNYMPRGQIKGAQRTQPPVSEICRAVRELEQRGKKADEREGEAKEEDEKKK